MRKLTAILGCLALLAGCRPDATILQGATEPPEDTGFQAEPDLPEDAPEEVTEAPTPIEPPTDTPDPTPEPPDPAPSPSEPPPPLHVYGNNIENLEEPTDGCPGDWRDLFYFMKVQAKPVDVFLVQQVANQAQLAALVKYMTDTLPGEYAGIIAQRDPAPMKSPCGAQKRTQTNAIIYRKGRLSPVGFTYVWQTWANIDNQCKRSRQARTYAVMQKFNDKQANKTVTVASIHWSTSQGGGVDPACAKENVLELDDKLMKPDFAAELYLWGGDTNEPDRNSSGYRPWYEVANADLGGRLDYRDPIFAKCKASATPLQTCLDNNATTRFRIDFLFGKDAAKKPAAFSQSEVISFADADAAARQVTGSDNAANYSDHRSVRAFVRY
jgi:hypothetical protein